MYHSQQHNNEDQGKKKENSRQPIWQSDDYNDNAR